MKILFIDTSINGHHKLYFETLIRKVGEKNSVLIVPEHVECLKNTEQIIVKENIKSIKGYLKWFDKIDSVLQKEKFDCIHFLYGDIFYRFMGIGLSRLKKYKVIVTFHHIRYGWLHEISIKRIFNNITRGIVHTAYLEKYLQSLNVKNVKHIEYPVFEKIHMLSEAKKIEVKNRYLIPQNTKVLLAYGGTRTDKGLDILLKALNNVKTPFCLVIAGKEQDIKEDVIDQLSEKYADKVIKILRFLSVEESNWMFNIADFVVLPYRKIFDGASGPLGIAILHQKIVIGPNHGSLGKIIEENHLGLTFQAENVKSLSEVIEKLLHENFTLDTKYSEYQKKLNEQNFAIEYFKLYEQ